MKFSTTDLATLRAAVAPLDSEDARATYREGRFPRADAVKDLNRRYRWDLFYAARGAQVVDLASYADAHIDTALRAIVPPLEA